ncbi:MAG: SufE family protein [Gemmatimonadota bacterium]
MGHDSIEQRADRLVDEFSRLEDWVERYQFLVRLGDTIARVPPDEKTEDNYIPGCQYDIWISADYDRARDAVHFTVDSDARVSRGLAALIIQVLDGQPPDAIVCVELDFLDRMGLRRHLSARRRTGLAAMVEEMRRRARSFIQDSE